MTSTTATRSTLLKSGLRVVTENIPGVRSAAVGVFVAVGSRDERASLNGASHFLEHLLFKGTPERSAMEISSLLDGVGGEFNAYTSREYTCYHARVLDEDLPMAVDVLGDMMTSSLITSADVEAEREVILDEIAMHDDDPDDLAHNLFAEAVWSGTSFSRPVAGTAGSITMMSREQIHRYYRTRYRPEAMTIAVAGNIDHTEVVSLVRKAFRRSDFLSTTANPLPARLAARPRPFRVSQVHQSRAFEQVSVILGMQGLTRSDPRRYALGIMSAALGGGSSARLFQEVRERRGLAYSVYSFASRYSDAGTVGVTAGCLPAKAPELLRVVREELAKVARDGFTEEEIARAKGQARGGTVLGLEDTMSRMTRLGESWLFQGGVIPIDEILDAVESVTIAEVNELASKLYAQPQSLATIGPTDPSLET
ncbi:MAG TPA: pitrilysin family protein [Marmoricola sp.]|nr:pitrilysin family protein [Marmoricola sp.]HNJ78810.1 pitrilysin family protein [Marmoricola sp.]